MTINVSGALERRLRDLASRQGRDLRAVVEDAIRRYLEDAGITDLTPAEVAATQEELLGELDITPTNGPRRGSPAAMDDVYAVLGERYASGESDVAARHDEHQP